MSGEKGDGDFSDNIEKDLCTTPLVDDEYLTEFRGRVNKFTNEQRSRSFGETFRKLEERKVNLF